MELLAIPADPAEYLRVHPGRKSAPDGEPKRKSNRWAILGGIFWIALFGFTFDKAARWESRPGEASSPRAISSSTRKGASYRLVMVAHPLCPCTQASLSVLSSLAQRHRDLNICIYFTEIPGVDSAQSKNLFLARSIDGAQVRFISEAEQDTTLGAGTSGQVYLISANGSIAFEGGITNGRGLDGDSTGARTIDAILAGTMTSGESDVFGCALATPESGK